MGRFFTVPFDDVATGTSDNTYKTMGAVLVPNTAGKRCCIREIGVGPADDTPLDYSVGVRLQRFSDQSTGTKTAITAANLGHLEADAVDGSCTGAHTYTVEPTTMDTSPIWQSGMNARGSLIKTWSGPADACPIAGQADGMALRICPRGTNASKHSGWITFEEY